MRGFRPAPVASPDPHIVLDNGPVVLLHCPMVPLFCGHRASGRARTGRRECGQEYFDAVLRDCQFICHDGHFTGQQSDRSSAGGRCDACLPPPRPADLCDGYSLSRGGTRFFGRGHAAVYRRRDRRSNGILSFLRHAVDIFPFRACLHLLQCGHRNRKYKNGLCFPDDQYRRLPALSVRSVPLSGYSACPILDRRAAVCRRIARLIRILPQKEKMAGQNV